MFPTITGIPEPFLTILAREGFIFSVGIHVLLQIFLGGACFSTDFTWQGLIGIVVPTPNLGARIKLIT